MKYDSCHGCSKFAPVVEQWPVVTLLPPVVAIALAITTRKVLVSLGVGVVLAAVFVADFRPLTTLSHLWSAFAGIFWTEGAVNTDSVFILVFLLILGVITALVLMSGGTEAFSDWAARRIHSRRGAKVLGAALGIAIFIDDYFNALAVGQVAKPVTDRYRVSRAKLAYIIDSTSAPVSVLAPFSSWGASIIGLLAPIILAAGAASNDVLGFLGAAAANYYAIGAVVMVIMVIWFGLDIGPMRTEERRALVENEMYADDAEIPGELSEDLPVHRPGALRSLIVPFVALVVGVIGAMFVTGWIVGGSLAPMDMLANTVVADSLLYGSLIGLASALWYYFKYTSSNDEFTASTLGSGAWEGTKSMLPAIWILLLAWTLGTLISDLGTGDFLGGLVTQSGLPNQWLIPILFVAGAGMAFSTGTSWGSFGLLIPLAGDILLAAGAQEYVIPALGAVLAGAVMGDHCSPISDTTILSSTGAGCEVVTHVSTQLPYALSTAAAALMGYVVLALTAKIWLGLLVMLVVLAAIIVIAAKTVDQLEKRHPLPEDVPAEA